MSSGAAITNSGSASNLSIAGASILAGNINTKGTQTYSGTVTLAAATQLTSTGSDGNISFVSTVDGATDNSQSLTLTSAGTMTFAAAVGATHPLSALTTGVGTTSLAGNVTTSGAQSYGGNVQLTSDVSLITTDNAVSIAGSVTQLTINNSRRYARLFIPPFSPILSACPSTTISGD
jgi:hypothetical protein